MSPFAYANTEIIANEEAGLPEEIQVLEEGSWSNMPGRPDFQISASDIDEYQTNFDAGKRAGVPIDIEHRQSKIFGEQAAGWVKGVYAKTKDNGKRALFIKPDFNKLGTELVGDKRFRFVSAEFIPASLGGQKDLEGKGILKNVLKAVTITNKPLMKGLPAIMASEDSESTSVLTYQLSTSIIKGSEGKNSMSLDAILAKDPSNISDEEKGFLTENKTRLSSTEAEKFLGEKAPVAASEGDEGTVTIKASELEELRAKANKSEDMEARMARLESAANAGVKASEELAKTKAEQEVAKHVQRGALKPDQRDKWVGQLVKASEEDHNELVEMLAGLPDGEMLASEKGDKKAGDIGGGAIKKLDELAVEEMKANEGMTYTNALLAVRSKNTVLASEADAEAANGEVA